MSIEYIFTVHPDYLLVTTTGHDDDLTEVLEYARTVLAHAMASARTRILLDERGIEYRIDQVDTFELAYRIASEAPRIARVALVTNPQNLPDAQFYEFVSKTQGLTVRVFREIEDAQLWLLGDED